MAKKDELTKLQTEVAQLQAKLANAVQREPLPWGIEAGRTYTRHEFMTLVGVSETTWNRMIKRGLPFTVHGGISGRAYQLWSEALFATQDRTYDRKPKPQEKTDAE